jgi:hypothetical protein
VVLIRGDSLLNPLFLSFQYLITPLFMVYTCRKVAMKVFLSFILSISVFTLLAQIIKPGAVKQKVSKTQTKPLSWKDLKPNKINIGLPLDTGVIRAPAAIPPNPKAFYYFICHGPYGGYYFPGDKLFEECLNSDPPFDTRGPFHYKGAGMILFFND